MTKEQAMIHTLAKENDELKAEIGRLRQALEQQPIAEERYQDLIEYFGDDDVAKCVLEDREEFKKWLERIKWHVRKANELARKLEQQPSEDTVIITMKKGTLKYSGKGYVVYNKDWFRKHFATEVAIMTGYDGYIEQPTSDDCVSRTQAIEWIENLRQMDKCFGNYEDDYFPLSEVIDRLKNVPPVTPTFPKGATNGDMIKAMFPNCKDWKAKLEDNDGEVYEVHFVQLPNSLTVNKYEESWWNAPYKRGSEE